MPAIRKSSDLRNPYGEISEFCRKNREPIFTTKNGSGDLAVMSIETYEERTGKRELYGLLQAGIEDIKKGNVLAEDEMDRSLDLM